MSHLALLPPAGKVAGIKLGIIARQNNLAFQGLQKDKKPFMVLVVVLVGVPRRTLMSAWIETRERTDLMATGIGRTLMSAWIETVFMIWYNR